MAATAQANPYQRLARKVGYSVGLEHLVARVKLLVDLYVKDRGLSRGAFNELVEKSYGRKGASQHFENFFGSINLVMGAGRTLEPVYRLDVLSILRRMFAADEDAQKYHIAVQFVLTQALVEEDGDIFLNGLLASFRPEQMREHLEAMVREKIAQVTQDFRSPHLGKRLIEELSIKNQSELKAGGDEGAPAGPFGRRSEPLNSSRRTGALSPQFDQAPSPIPDDYIGKVSTTRKGWAQDLGLFESGVRTSRADRLLTALSETVISRANDPEAALFWGYRQELEVLMSKLQITIPAAKQCELWDMLCAVSYAFTGDVPATTSPFSKDDTVAFLKSTMSHYQEGNASRGLIRNSLPLYVAEPVLAAACTANNKALPDLPNILEEEFERPGRKRIQKMIIRGTAGALFFMA